MSVKHWPLSEQPRERLLKDGAAALSNAELLAIILVTGIKGKNVLVLAQDILNHFGSLSAFLEADFKSFSEIPGLAKTKYIQIHAMLEFCRRYWQELLPEQMLFNHQNVQEFLQARLRHYSHEVFSCIFLDNQNRFIQYKELFHGTIHSTPVYPRTIAQACLRLNAAAIILAHNHPSGLAQPSQSDIDITLQLKESLKWIDVEVLDHIIVAKSKSVSLASLGLL